MAAQISPEEAGRQGDCAILNDSSLVALRRRTAEVYACLVSKQEGVNPRV
jgi:hypothetical protein